MDVSKITNEISSPALKELATCILKTVEDVRSGKTDYQKGMTELSGYKQVIQIMALESMRFRLPMQPSISGR